MKMIAAIPVALLTLGALGCSQQASTASTPAVQHPAGAAGSSETNTFGENKEEATGSAASARDANYGGTPPAADQAAAPSSSTAESASPK